MKFDVVFSNPPYNKNIDIKILNEIINFADEWVIIHPSLWLLDAKCIFKAYNDFRGKIANHLKSVEMFNGNYIFDIELNVPIVITHIDLNYNGKIDVRYFSENFKSENTNDITKFGSKWKNFVEDFYNNIKSYCLSNGSVWDKRIDFTSADPSKFHSQFADIRGSKNKKSKTEELVKDDFYTIAVRENPQDNRVLRKDTLKNTYQFDTEQERENFLKYINTDFARFCLSILKTNTHIDSGELSLIPWLDFTEEWDDGKLFEKFEVSEELQKYIRIFLPDYYGIRK